MRQPPRPARGRRVARGSPIPRGRICSTACRGSSAGSGAAQDGDEPAGPVGTPRPTSRTGNIPQFDSSQGRLPPSVSLVLQAPRSPGCWHGPEPPAGRRRLRRPRATRLEEVPLPPPQRAGTAGPPGPPPAPAPSVPAALRHAAAPGAPVAEAPRAQAAAGRGPVRPAPRPAGAAARPAGDPRDRGDDREQRARATASARRETLKRRLAKEVRGLPPEKRQALVDRLRTHFPLAVPPPVVVDAGR